MSERVLVKNAGDPEQVRNAESVIARQGNQDELDLQSILELPHGRRLLWRLLGKANIFASTFNPGMSPNDTIYLEGKRAYGLWLLNEINQASPSAYLEMAQEAALSAKAK